MTYVNHSNSPSELNVVFTSSLLSSFLGAVFSGKRGIDFKCDIIDQPCNSAISTLHAELSPIMQQLLRSSNAAKRHRGWRQSRGWNFVVGATSLFLLVSLPICAAFGLHLVYKSDSVASIQEKLPEFLKHFVLKPKINRLLTKIFDWLQKLKKQDSCFHKCATKIFDWLQKLEKEDSCFHKCASSLKYFASSAWSFIIQKHNEIRGAAMLATSGDTVVANASTATNIVGAPVAVTASNVVDVSSTGNSMKWAWKTFADSISGFVNFFFARIKDFFHEDGMQKLNIDNLKTSRQEFVRAFLLRAAESHFKNGTENGIEAAKKFVKVASGLKEWLDKGLPPNEESELFKNLDEVWGKWSNVREGKFDLTKTRWWVNINFLNAMMAKNEVRAISRQLLVNLILFFAACCEIAKFSEANGLFAVHCDYICVRHFGKKLFPFCFQACPHLAHMV